MNIGAIAGFSMIINKSKNSKGYIDNEESTKMNNYKITNNFCLQQNINRKCSVTKQEPILSIICSGCPSLIQVKK